MSELLNVKQLARSKQRHSYNKDKHHSKRGRGRGGEAGRGGGEAGRGGGEAGRGRGRGAGPITNEESDDSDEDEEEENERTDTSKFRRRQVVAQERQFESINEPVDDDEIPKVDIDYLLNQPIKEVADAHFRFADETDWEYSGVPNTMIVIDCAKIAQKMKQLTISQRLDLDLSRFGEPPLEELDPLKINHSLKFISLHPEISSTAPLQPQKHVTPEDSFLEDILTSNPATHKEDTPQFTSAPVPSTTSPTHPTITATPSPTLPVQTTNSGEKEKEKKIENVNKASVEDLEDWLDSVI